MRAAALPLVIISLLAGCSSEALKQSGTEIEVRSANSVAAAEVSKVTASAPATKAEPSLTDARSPLSSRSFLFEKDSHAIRAADRELLGQHASFLASNPGHKMLIQGHADERGTMEYNLALGQKRADAVKQALQQHGVKASQLKTVSMGKKRPLCYEKKEACWAKNRRVELLYSGEF